jgi:acetyl esterase/lipase
MSDVLYELFKDYEGTTWLTHIESDPSLEARKRMPELMKEMEAYPMAPGNELDFLDDNAPPGVTREDIDAPHGLHMYHYEPKDKNPAEERTIYYVHGGGFMRGNEYWCRTNAILQVKHIGLPVYACEYRYIPEHKYPKAIDDVEWGWNYLVNDLGLDPKKIIITGESAGGTYEMSLMMRLKRQGRELPAGCICISGMLDISTESPSYTLNNGIDPIFSLQPISTTSPGCASQRSLRNTRTSRDSPIRYSLRTIRRSSFRTRSLERTSCTSSASVPRRTSRTDSRIATRLRCPNCRNHIRVINVYGSFSDFKTS